jgi:hypothetical protein
MFRSVLHKTTEQVLPFADVPAAVAARWKSAALLAI